MITALLIVIVCYGTGILAVLLNIMWLLRDIRNAAVRNAVSAHDANQLLRQLAMPGEHNEPPST